MRRASGFIALTAVLLLSAVALVIGIGVLLRALDEESMQATGEQAVRAEAAVTLCAEVALNRLKANVDYPGNETLSQGGDTCSILSVGGVGNTDRTIRATSTVMGASRAVSITILQIDPIMRISSWQDVVGF